MRNDFCVFILSYKRANNMCTIDSLLRANYTGKYYIILGNDDPTINEYIDKYGKDKIIIFDKEEQARLTDACDNFDKRKVILYARNFCFDIAKQLGYKYFLELDDDYTNFRYRYEEDGQFRTCYVREFDELVDIMIDFLDTTNAHTVAFGQSGDYIGGGWFFSCKSKNKKKSDEFIFLYYRKTI